ncbi:MAG: hypothetical protein FJ265_11505 [Planctomycetes bacterium]|nr:hypothetical protein [Planctomycetota bacterium]
MSVRRSRSPYNPLTAAAVLALAATASAQVGTNYSFAQAVGTYTPITVGTLISQGSPTNTLDDSTFTVPLPFPFTYDATIQTQITVCTNGWLAFGAGVLSTYTPISSTAVTPGYVAACGRDLQSGFVFGATRTSGSPTLTNVNLTSNGPLQVGDSLVGTGIPTGTTVLAIAGNVITMSANATSTSATPAAVTAYGPWSTLRSDVQGTSPNQVFTVQWSGFRRFGTTLTTNQDLELNFQIRLYEASGQIEAVYGNCTPGVTTYATSVHQTGLRGPNNTFPANVNCRQNTKGTNDWATSAPGISNAAGQVFNNVAPANVIPNGLTYTWAPPTGVPATNTAYGTGCLTASATWYELFGTYDLGGTSVLMLPNVNGGYTMLPGTPTAFVHTVPGLALGDDQNGTLALPSAFNYPGGSTTTLTICSNGFIWMQPNVSTDYSPSVAELFSSAARVLPLWCDMVPDGATNVNNVFAEVDLVNNKAYVTWVNVPTYTVGGTVNMQIEFDLTTGTVNYTYGATTLPVITSIVGWTPGVGFSTVNAGSIDVSASLAGTFSTSATESVALALSAAPTPALGATVTYTTSNIPLAALISANLLSIIQVNPGLPLGGAPGCFTYVDLLTASTSLLFGAPTATQTFTVPNNTAFVGLPINVQSASYVPGINALNVITSNGMQSVIGNY